MAWHDVYAMFEWAVSHMHIYTCCCCAVLELLVSYNSIDGIYRTYTDSHTYLATQTPLESLCFYVAVNRSLFTRVANRVDRFILYKSSVAYMQ